MNRSHKSQSLGERAYSLLLYLYPARFRREFGEEMRNTYIDMTRDSMKRSGRLGLVLLWPNLTVDLLATAFVQHVQFECRRMNMFRVRLGYFFNTFARMNFFLKFAVVLAISALATPPDPATQLVAAIPLYAIYRLFEWSYSLGARESMEKKVD